MFGWFHDDGDNQAGESPADDDVDAESQRIAEGKGHPVVITEMADQRDEETESGDESDSSDVLVLATTAQTSVKHAGRDRRCQKVDHKSKQQHSWSHDRKPALMVEDGINWAGIRRDLPVSEGA